jgi:hypothetical protein
MIKNLMLAVMLLSGSIALAGGFSEIDLVVRQTVYEEYSKGPHGNKFEMDPARDIWSLEIASSVPECLVLVQGLAKKPSYYGATTYRFWVCVNMGQDGAYSGELVDEEQIADE